MTDRAGGDDVESWSGTTAERSGALRRKLSLGTGEAEHSAATEGMCDALGILAASADLDRSICRLTTTRARSLPEDWDW